MDRLLDARTLADLLPRLDGRGFKAYRDLRGGYRFDAFSLFVDHVQSDPFASPSKLRLRVARERAALPDDLWTNPVRQVAAENWLARRLRFAIEQTDAPERRQMGSGHSGVIQIDAGGPEVLERTAFLLASDFVEARIEVGLPADGRRVRAAAAADLLLGTLPEIVRRGLLERSADDDTALACFVDCVENQESIRGRLAEQGLIAFVGDGALLPRRSGASQAPMPPERCVPFEAPASQRVEFEVPHADAGFPGRVWRGLGVPKGVVLLVGGGYHGKSTLLQAIERSVVPHGPGDGRETVVADAALVKVRAEDGRSVAGVDIHGFIDRLPAAPGVTPPDPARFSTDDASGSTSQAAQIAEAIEAGARGLLLDEDTSATNFMVRDARMQALVHPEDEPITPFLERVRALYEDFGISTLLVMGGSGDYFRVADVVLELRAYQTLDVTARAAEIARDPRFGRVPDDDSGKDGGPSRRTPLERPQPRKIDPASLDPRRGRREVHLASRGVDELVYGRTVVDLRGIEQLFDPSQTRAIASAIHRATRDWMDPDATVAEVLDAFEAALDREGLEALDLFGQRGEHPGALARPRRFELAAVLNRVRGLALRADPTRAEA